MVDNGEPSVTTILITKMPTSLAISSDLGKKLNFVLTTVVPSIVTGSLSSSNRALSPNSACRLTLPHKIKPFVGAKRQFLSLIHI